MFQVQQPSKKERSKLGYLTAPSNMLSFRSASSGSPTTSNSSQQPTSNQTAQTSQPVVNGHVHRHEGQSPSFVVAGDLPSAHMTVPQLPSMEGGDNHHHKVKTGPKTLTGSGIVQSHSQHHNAQSGPASNVIPSALPGPASQLADIPTAPSFSTKATAVGGSLIEPPAQVTSPSKASTTSTSRRRIPQSRRPHADPFEAPGVTFRNTLTPPSSAQIPDIPYGEGQGQLRKKLSRKTSIGKAKVFTPADSHRGIRINAEDEKEKKTVDNTAVNTAAAPAGAAHTIIASSKHAPSELVTPNAVLTGSQAPIVAPRTTVMTEVDASEMQKLHESATTKQPPKSALKAKSWADLVRPPTHAQLAEEAVKNVGLPPDADKKKRVSIALPSKSAAGEVASTTVPTHSHTKTAAGNDKTPRHVSPPPAEKAEQAEDTIKPAKKAPSIMTNATGVTSTSGVVSNMIARKKTLEEILTGVENSASPVTLYPRGLVNTGNACFMNAILQSLLFTGPFYNLISLVGLHTSEDLSGKTPLLDAMVSYLSEFKTSDPQKEAQLNRGESYDEGTGKSEAFVPTIIYHALNHSNRFTQMGFHNPSGASNGTAPLTAANIQALNASNHLSQEDAQEFLGFFLDTIHEELLIKMQQHDKQIWEKASKGVRAGYDSLARQSVNSAAEFDALQAPPGASNASVVYPGQSASEGGYLATDFANHSQAGAEDDEWLEVGTKGRTATTRTTQRQESPVTRIFGGQLRSVLKCPGQKDSVTLQPYMSLQLEIQPANIQTITDAIMHLAQPETLSDVANKQNLKVEATKQVFIEDLPPVLILHLQRFIYNEKKGGVLKSHKTISYELELDVPKEAIAPTRRSVVTKTRYRLAGVVFHHGKTASGGHYTVNVRQNNGRWVNIDDTTITPIPAEAAAVDADKERLSLSLPSASSLHGVPEKSAYLLFYQRI